MILTVKIAYSVNPGYVARPGLPPGLCYVVTKSNQSHTNVIITSQPNILVALNIAIGRTVNNAIGKQ